MTLPEYARICPLCEGTRVYPLNTFTPCEMCRFPGRAFECAGYIYKATAQPVPESVVQQIERAQ